MVHAYVFPLDGYIPHRGDYLEDSGQMTWNLWFVAESILNFENPFITKMVFYPVGTNLGTHTLVSGWFPVAILVKLLSGNSDYYAIYAFNIVVLLSFFFLALFTFLSLRKIRFDFLPSLIPAWGYAFCSFYYWHWKHLNLMGMFTAPMVLFFGIRLFEKPTRTRTLVLAGVLAWSVYITEMTVFTTMGVALFVVLALLIPQGRRLLWPKLKALGWLNTLIGGLLFITLVSPFVYYYAISEITPPNEQFFSTLSTNAAALFLPERNATGLYGSLFEPLASKINKGLGGREAFIGIPIIIFLLVGLVKRKSVFYWLSFGLAIFFIVLGFGPTLKFLNIDTGIWLPYGSLMKIPPFTQNRCPVRISLIGIFLLMPIVGLGLQSMQTFLTQKFNSKTAYGLLAAVFVWTVAEKYTPPPQERLIYRVDAATINAMSDGPVISTSMPSRACNQAVFQTFHKRPTANFCHARTTLKQQAHMNALRSALNQGPDKFVAILQQKGIRNIHVDNRLPFVTIDALRKSPLTTVESVPHPRVAVKSVGVAEKNEPTSVTNRPVWKISPNQAVRVELARPTQLFSIEILANAGDTLRVSLFLEDEKVHTVTLGPIRKASGLRWKIADIWDKNIVTDNLEITAVNNRAGSSVSALVLTTK